MIKINVITNNINWYRYIKNPNKLDKDDRNDFIDSGNANKLIIEKVRILIRIQISMII